MIYFLFITLFKLIASSFCKKVADVFHRPSVLIETPEYYLKIENKRRESKQTNGLTKEQTANLTKSAR